VSPRLLGWCTGIQLASVLGSVSCGSPTTLTGVQATDVAAYTAEQQDCVSASTTLPQAKACVAAVRARWCGYGGSLQQLGGCGLDAGPESGMPIPSVLSKALGLTDGGGQ